MLKHTKERAIVLLSGGIDSTACAHLLLSKDIEISALFVDYGQPARNCERESSENVCKFYNIPLATLRLESKKSFSHDEIIGRNAFLVFSALMFSKKSEGLIATGIHSGTPYYDCSVEFHEKVAELVSSYSSGKMNLFSPFLTWNKEDIYTYCFSRKVPVDITYSCERGTVPPCGKCLSCKDRRKIEC